MPLEGPRLCRPQLAGEAGKGTEQQLHASIQRLTEAITEITSASNRRGANTGGLQEAYASIVRLLPKRHAWHCSRRCATASTP